MFAHIKCFFAGFKDALSDKWILTAFLVCCGCFSYAFMQNFVFSSNLDQLSFRTVDDLAFQYTLRNNHEHLRFFGLNSYAYGWLFWFPVTVLTYPAYLISKYGGDDTLLIVIPRNISLLFTIGTMIVLYKICCHYTRNNLLVATALILFLSFPTTGYFSLRFGTVSQTAFFSALAFYIAISRKSYDVKSIGYIGAAAGAALAVKLSAMLILPFIGLILADRLNWKISKENFKKAGIFIGTAIVTYLALGQPNFREILAQIQTTKISYGDNLPLIDNLQASIFGPFLHQFIFAIFLTGLLVLAVRNIRNNRDYLFVFISILMCTAYLLATIKMGAAYISVYATVYMYLLLLGVVSLDYLKAGSQIAVCGILIVSGVLLNFENIYSKDAEKLPISWNSFYLAQEDDATLANIEAQNKINLILNKKGWKREGHISILRDYRSPEVISSVKSNVDMIVSYDNFTLILNGKKSSIYDLIVFSKSGVGFMTAEDFDKRSSNADASILEVYQGDRAFVTEFLKTRKLGGQTYSEIYADKKNIVFLRNGF